MLSTECLRRENFIGYNSIPNVLYNDSVIDVADSSSGIPIINTNPMDVISWEPRLSKVAHAWNRDGCAPAAPISFYTSRNRPTGVKTLREAEVEYGQLDDNGNFNHSDDVCKDRVLEIKDQVAGYESYTRLKEKAKNLIMGSISKDLWHQCVNKEDPRHCGKNFEVIITRLEFLS